MVTKLGGAEDGGSGATASKLGERSHSKTSNTTQSCLQIFHARHKSQHIN